MSRIAKMPIKVPMGVEVAIARGGVSVKGPKGVLRLEVHSAVEVAKENGFITCAPRNGLVDSIAQTGTVRSLVALCHMVRGVSEGFEKELQLVGVGYRAQINDNFLKLALGFSHTIEYRIPDDVKVETRSATRILVSGADKQRVGQIAAEIRAYRPPEPYKGKGVRYARELVARKEAKKKQKQ